MPAFTVPVRVRWSDLDPLGHVNNVRMLEFVQESRVSMLADTGVFDHGGSSFAGVSQVVARQEINYRRPIFLRSEVVVSSHVSRIGTTSYDLEFTILTEDGMAADGRTVLVVVDVSGSKTPIPEAFRTRLEQLRP